MLPTFAVGNLETRLLQIEARLAELTDDDDHEQTLEAAALTDEADEIKRRLAAHDEAVYLELLAAREAEED